MKDPAALIYIDKWLVSTKGMRGNTRGWYLNLILHQYDKGELPNDIEELANLADVRISEYEDFKQVFEHVLKQKFVMNENGMLENLFASEIIQKRETFKDKRSDSGKLSYVLKYLRAHYKYKKGFEEYFKNTVSLDFDIKNEQVLKQVFEQTLELYINEDKDIIRVFDFKKSILLLGIELNILEDWLKVRKNKRCSNTETAFNKIKNEILKCNIHPNDCIKIAVEKSWGGFEAEWINNLNANGNSTLQPTASNGYSTFRKNTAGNNAEDKKRSVDRLADCAEAILQNS